MSKGKLAKFADMETYPNVFQYPYSVVSDVPFALRGQWHEQYFHNQNPITLELGCGKGEYAVELARQNAGRNYIGVDIKGARMWTGATQALRNGLKNVAFLRTNIEIIDRFFAPGEVQELWLTFSDPQMKNPRKRLTSTYFLERYRRFLEDGGIVHLKTDSNFLFTYTRLLVERNGLPLEACTDDLYGSLGTDAPSAPASPSSPAAAPASPSSPVPFPDAYLQAAGAIQTYYERMWLERGLNIRYLRFRLPHAVPLAEPDVEIPLDDYRSYHRQKRSSLDVAK